MSIDEGEFLAKPVQAITIDGLAKKFGSPDVLFLDIEGYEIAARRGAQETLKIRQLGLLRCTGMRY